MLVQRMVQFQGLESGIRSGGTRHIKLGDQTHWADRVRYSPAKTFDMHVNPTSTGAKYEESEMECEFFSTLFK